MKVYVSGKIKTNLNSGVDLCFEIDGGHEIKVNKAWQSIIPIFSGRFAILVQFKYFSTTIIILSQNVIENDQTNNPFFVFFMRFYF